MAKKTWKDRLVKEYKKLNIKEAELDSFIEGNHGNFINLPEPDRDLLMTQHALMVAYINILDMRMKRLGLRECDNCKETKKAFFEALKEKLGKNKVLSKNEITTAGPFESIEELITALVEDEEKKRNEEDGRN